MSHPGQTASEVTISNLSTYEISDLPNCLLTKQNDAYLIMPRVPRSFCFLPCLMPFRSLCPQLESPPTVAKVGEAHLERKKKWGVRKKKDGVAGSKQIYRSARTSSCQGLSRRLRGKAGPPPWEWLRGGGGVT